MIERSIDVVIPSFRLDERFLVPILELERPANTSVRFIIVADDPSAPVPAAITERARIGDITLLRNSKNLGAGGARNRGLEAGDGELVVFLDDDVEPRNDLLLRYVAAIDGDDTDAPGYVGVTRFPPPVNAFTRGVVASDMLTFFDIAATRATLLWGVTANLCIRRAAVGRHRFSSDFPSAGGGEDIDLCLRVITDANHAPLRSVPDAIVTHPWWSSGRRHYLRFFRWAFGDSVLPALHTAHRYRAAPTLPEALLIALPVLGLLVTFGRMTAGTAAAVIAALFLVEPLVEFAKLRLRGVKVGPRTALEATAIRFANEVGRVCGHFRWRRPSGFCERFDYFGTRESVAYERRVALAKLIGWSVACAALVGWPSLR